MKDSDVNLLKIYMQGFRDELHGKKEQPQPDLLSKNAYALGRLDALVGDEISDLDFQSDKQILNRIHNL